MYLMVYVPLYALSAHWAQLADSAYKGPLLHQQALMTLIPSLVKYHLARMEPVMFDSAPKGNTFGVKFPNHLTIQYGHRIKASNKLVIYGANKQCQKLLREVISDLKHLEYV